MSASCGLSEPRAEGKGRAAPGGSGGGVVTNWRFWMRMKESMLKKGGAVAVADGFMQGRCEAPSWMGYADFDR